MRIFLIQGFIYPLSKKIHNKTERKKSFYRLVQHSTKEKKHPLTANQSLIERDEQVRNLQWPLAIETNGTKLP